MVTRRVAGRVARPSTRGGRPFGVSRPRRVVSARRIVAAGGRSRCASRFALLFPVIVVVPVRGEPALRPPPARGPSVVGRRRERRRARAVPQERSGIGISCPGPSPGHSRGRQGSDQSLTVR